MDSLSLCLSDKKNTCIQCGTVTNLKCGNCHKENYCSEKCQLSNRIKHSQHCYPFMVAKNDILGRYAVATRDIRAGEVILKEMPLLIGPLETTATLCLGCYQPISDVYRCEKCSWPLCGKSCESSEHHQPECQLTQTVKNSFGPSIDKRSYMLIVPLRALYLRGNKKKLAQLMSLQSTSSDQNTNEGITSMTNDIISMLKKIVINNNNDSNVDSFIRHLIGVIQINGYDIEGAAYPLMGLYSNCSIFEHSCLANSKREFDSSYQLIFKASIDISKGENISAMYTKVLWGTTARQKQLLDHKFFVCQCKRCSDPTELGSFFSAVKCNYCSDDGYLLPENSSTIVSKWRCNECSHSMSDQEIQNILQKIEEDVELIVGAPKLDKLENFLERCVASKLHPNHFLLFKIKFMLIQMMANPSKTNDMAAHFKKENMCKEFLELCSRIDPGSGLLSRYVTVVLFEYGVSIISRLKLSSNSVKVNEFKDNSDVKLAKSLLEKCVALIEGNSGIVLRSMAIKYLQDIT